MDIPFKREQGHGGSGKVNFKLWGKVELDADEREIVKRYKFDQAILIDADQPGLMRKSALVGLGIAIAIGIMLYDRGSVGLLIAIAAGIGGGYVWYHQRRETIYVKDLLHGRNFACDSVIELAKKEAWLGCLTSAPLGQNWVIEQRRISGSS